MGPRLLWQDFESLRRTGESYPHSHPDFPDGGMFWDVADFDDLGSLQIPGEIPLTTRNLHPWERRSKSGALPVVPTQRQLTPAEQRRRAIPQAHPCSVCGTPVAPFGVDGNWYCREHRP